MYMRKGAVAAEQKDYEGAFIAYRKAYAFDPVNELAKSEMARMSRLQQAVLDGAAAPEDKTVENGKVKLVQTGYTAKKAVADDPLPQKLEKMRSVPFPG